MMNREPLERAIEANTTAIYPTTFKEVAAGYREKYGEHGWIGLLAQEISGSAARKGKEYSAARRAIERQAAGQYKGFKKAEYITGTIKAGQSLPPIRRELPPGKGLTVEITFRAPGDKGHAPRERTAIINLDHNTATMIATAPTYADLFDEWFDDGGDVYGEDGDYEADVVAVSAY